MSSQARGAGSVWPDRVAGSTVAHLWLTRSWASDAAAPAGRRIGRAEGADGSVTVRVLGDLDLCSSPELQTVLADLLRARRPAILDLSETRFIDCGGLAVVLWAAGAARAEEWSFGVAAERAACVDRLIVLVDVGSVIPRAQLPVDRGLLKQGACDA